MNNKSVYITQTNCITPLGFDVSSNWDALLHGKSGIQLHKNVGNLEEFYASIISTDWLDEVFKKTVFPFSVSDKKFTKLEKMLLLALMPLVEKYQISNRTAFVFSTTKGNISSLELDSSPVKEAQLAFLAKKISSLFGFTTEPIVLSNACVSGVLAIAVAKRMIQVGVYDDAFIVAGDEVSEFVLSGFNSFQAMSEIPCKPYDSDRNGVNLGEATAAVYLTSDKNKVESNAIKVCGDGAINDANHISGPSRTGEG
ncbi:MAG: beta-ketoacyl synthase, partial [Aequorivita sp.]|nr:beta-ketoacyl synthase [Aequorivita sp.]